MRRTKVILPAALMLLVLVPASALARHHRQHHARVRHARIERFGRDVATAPTTAGSADNAGTVKSFSNGVLTITLGDGSTATGAVTRDTELECMAPAQNQTIHEDGDGGSGDQSGSGDRGGSGDDQAEGPSDQSSGDDQGDAAEQNENQAEDQNENEMESCSSSSLSQGTVVHEAELRLSSAGSVWKKVELGS